jgi:aryl-alcohol dehydrogenase-like predicted oxidoreductase
MKRRDFINKIGLSAGALAAAGLPSCVGSTEEAAQQTAGNRDTTEAKAPTVGIKTYTAIGATGLKMSDVSMGCGGLDNPYVVDHGIDVGINYFDTAPDYGSGGSERTLGKVFKDSSSKRDKCIIASKFCEEGRYGLHIATGTPAATYIEEVEKSLRRLNTDRIEFMMVHAIGERDNDKARLLDPEMLSAVTKLKEQGKILHLATSSHGPNKMEERLLDAIESGHYAMFMPAMNFMEHPRLDEVLKKAKEKNVGVVAMKSLAGAKDEDLSKYRGEGTSLVEAAFKWLFTKPGVNGLVITMTSTADVDQYVAASGKRFSAADQKILDWYASDKATEYCRTGCGDCLAHCPHGVATAAILRYDMYFTSYRDHLKALKEYRTLPRAMKPHACTECDGPCTAGCKFGVPVRERMLQAAERLEFA